MAEHPSLKRTLRVRVPLEAPIGKTMKEIKWIRVEDVQPYIDSENYSDDFPDKRVRRLYHAKGSDYPLLYISINPNSEYVVSNKPFTGIRIGVAFKEKKDEWWYDKAFDAQACIPPQLYDELTDMLAEAKKKFK